MRRDILLSGVSALALMVAASATPAHAANIALPFTETSVNGVETLSVGYAGAIITGTTDDWTITLPGLSLLQISDVWVEAPGDPGYNVLSVPVAHGDVITLLSEDLNPPYTSGAFSLGESILAGTAGGNFYYASVNEKTVSAVPEPASLALFGIGLAGLGVARRRRRKPV